MEKDFFPFSSPFWLREVASRTRSGLFFFFPAGWRCLCFGLQRHPSLHSALGKSLLSFDQVNFNSAGTPVSPRHPPETDPSSVRSPPSADISALMGVILFFFLLRETFLLKDFPPSPAVRSFSPAVQQGRLFFFFFLPRPEVVRPDPNFFRRTPITPLPPLEKFPPPTFPFQESYQVKPYFPRSPGFHSWFFSPMYPVFCAFSPNRLSVDFSFRRCSFSP